MQSCTLHTTRNSQTGPPKGRRAARAKDRCSPSVGRVSLSPPPQSGPTRGPTAPGGPQGAARASAEQARPDERLAHTVQGLIPSRMRNCEDRIIKRRKLFWKWRPLFFLRVSHVEQKSFPIARPSARNGGGHFMCNLKTVKYINHWQSEHRFSIINEY